MHEKFIINIIFPQTQEKTQLSNTEFVLYSTNYNILNYLFIYLFSETGERKEKERNTNEQEKHLWVASHTSPNLGHGPKPRHVP